VYRAPSWSWASIDGRVWYDSKVLDEEDLDRRGYLYKCHIVQQETTLKSARAPLGEITSASLRIKAVLRQAWFIPSTRNVLWLAENDPTLAAAETQHLANFRRDCPEDAHDFRYAFGDNTGMIVGQYDVWGDFPPALVFCLPIMGWEETLMGLLLTPADIGTFKRVGLFEAARRNDFEHLQQVEITIV
jgi:hypothetical protein